MQRQELWHNIKAISSGWRASGGAMRQDVMQACRGDLAWAWCSRVPPPPHTPPHAAWLPAWLRCARRAAAPPPGAGRSRSSRLCGWPCPTPAQGGAGQGRQVSTPGQYTHARSRPPRRAAGSPGLDQHPPPWGTPAHLHRPLAPPALALVVDVAPRPRFSQGLGVLVIHSNDAAADKAALQQLHAAGPGARGGVGVRQEAYEAGWRLHATAAPAGC
jgi:hypothetical protein